MSSTQSCSAIQAASIERTLTSVRQRYLELQLFV